MASGMELLKRAASAPGGWNEVMGKNNTPNDSCVSIKDMVNIPWFVNDITVFITKENLDGTVNSHWFPITNIDEIVSSFKNGCTHVFFLPAKLTRLGYNVCTTDFIKDHPEWKSMEDVRKAEPNCMFIRNPSDISYTKHRLNNLRLDIVYEKERLCVTIACYEEALKDISNPRDLAIAQCFIDLAVAASIDFEKLYENKL